MSNPSSSDLPCLFRLRSDDTRSERSFLLSPGSHHLGRAPSNRLALPDEGVSRRHAVVRVSPEQVIVEDARSRNGTFVNGVQVERAALAPGDKVAFGPVELRLEELHPEDAQLAMEISRPAPGADNSGERSWEALPDLRFPDGWVSGVSPAMTALCDQLRPLVGGDLPVLVVGETGVGKELIARTLHLSSPRRQGPFVAINCAAIPADLLEAELFGIGERVATGVAGRKGYFQRAAGGTLFLDEIGEMSAALQAKLLRVLQEKTLQPVGGVPIPIDVRVVAATNADVEAMIERGTFRRDLFYRIAGFVLRVPPLCERREDVAVLVESLLRRFSAESGKPVRGVSVRALRALVEYHWPGNVRELEHVVRRLVYLCPPGEAIELAMLPESIAAPAAGEPPRRCSAPGSRVEAAPHPPPPAGGTEGDQRPGVEDSAGAEALDLAALERRTIREALRRCDGNKVQAARLLGLSRSALRRRLERLGL